MRKLLRETIRTIEKAGGEDVRVEERSRHSFIHFTIQGRPELLTLIHGINHTRRQQPSLRSELRRKGLLL
jgi:hypothetical protein